MEHSVKLWGRATSFNVQKVAWVAAELDLSCKRIDLGGIYGGLDDPKYVAMNPNKKVPTLVDGDLVLWESNAICRYLVDAYGTPSTLKSNSAQRRGQADMWMEWFQNNVYASFIGLFHQVVRMPPSQRDPEKRVHLNGALTDMLRVVETALAGRKFILGDELSLGDIPVGAALFRYYSMEIERAPLPNLERYFSDLQQRQSYQDAVMVDYSSLRGFD